MTQAAQQEKGQGTADQRVRREDRPADEMKYEVSQRGGIKDAHGDHATDGHPEADRMTRPDAPAGKKQTSGYGNREDRENPAAAPQESGQKQSHELPGNGTRVGNDETNKPTQTR